MADDRITPELARAILEAERRQDEERNLFARIDALTAENTRLRDQLAAAEKLADAVDGGESGWSLHEESDRGKIKEILFACVRFRATRTEQPS